MAGSSNESARPGDVIYRSMFLTDQFDRALRLDATRAYTGPFFEVTPAPDGNQEVDASSISYLLHDLVLNETTYGPMRMERPDRRRLTSQHEYVTVWLILKGQQDGIIDDTPFHAHAGEIHLFDGAPSMRLVSKGPRALSAHIPYAAIGFDPSLHPPYLMIPADRALFHVVAATLRALRAQAPMIKLTEAEEVSRGLCSLLRSAFGLDPSGSPEPQFANYGRALAMRAFLDNRLHDRSVGARTLCQTFNVSRATVYRLFADEGGVDVYIRRRRLERALADVAAATSQRGAVSRAAERWGFDDPSHFHRRFRERYGMSPTDAAALVRAAQSGTKEPRATNLPFTPVFDWLVSAHSLFD